jgi:RNA methyltransferase, TrmH family
MLTRAQEKLIKSLHNKKGREKSGFCLVEGQKVIDMTKDAVEYVFHPNDSEQYEQLVTTETPQRVAAVVKIPKWNLEQVLNQNVIVVLDGVQDPGNVGTILRLCLGFDASLILIESVDVSSPKVIRSSVGAMFRVPWIKIEKSEALLTIQELQRPVFRLERSDHAISVSEVPQEQIVLITGSEGQGIQLEIEGKSLQIEHNEALESLNVANALGIILHSIYSSK